jgi:hypothetical protein
MRRIERKTDQFQLVKHRHHAAQFTATERWFDQHWFPPAFRPSAELCRLATEEQDEIIDKLVPA